MSEIGCNFHQQDNPATNIYILQTMKSKTENTALESLSLTAVISCVCSVLYFVVANLLA